MVMTTPVPSEERLRNRSKKGISGRYARTRCEPALRASLETPDQNRLETSREKSSALERELESESQNGNPSVMARIGSVSQRGSSASADSLINAQLGEQ